jgi:hypothetical protein
MGTSINAMIRYFEKSLGNALFPHLERWERRRCVRSLLLIALIEMAVAGLIASILMLGNQIGK